MKLNFVFWGLALFGITVGHGMATETKRIAVSIKPLHSLVAGVMGEAGMPELIVAGSVSPHDVHLKPSHIKALQSTRVLFYIDDTFEMFLQDIFKTLSPQVRKVAVVQKASLKILSQRKGGTWVKHTYENHEHHPGDGQGGPQYVRHEESHKYTHADMHVWLDPENTEKIVTFIAQELSTIYPEKRDIYHVNARTLLDRLHALDVKLKEELSGVEHKPFIVLHDAYQYFEKRYGLSSVGSITFEPDEFPSSSRLKALRQKVQEEKAVCVFREPYFNDRLITPVIEGSKAKIHTLDPEATTLEPGKDLYFNLMENLAKNMKDCLSP